MAIVFTVCPFGGDIARAMVNEGLTFLRYGGGTMVNAPGYRWKNMIGDPSGRTPYKGHWYPYSTNGFGIFDFLNFCRSRPFPVCVCGSTSKRRPKTRRIWPTI